MMTKIALKTLPALLLFAHGAEAQMMPRTPPGAGEAQITVNFSIPFFSDERDPIKLIAAQSQFRKQLYEVASRECVALVETIADECRLVSMNVNVQNQSQMATIMNANAQYRVTLKGK
ncbi:hypothetical protein [Terrarubrum flagellatum]|uniref:hypothetical protein n=1 Tax=Terrirubrum flagellatum TaxID=2895980 RepID=UPI003144F083